MRFLTINSTLRGCAAVLVTAAFASLAVFLSSRHAVMAAAADSAPRRPVLVELFTSEGCSSCPPADALLARLDREQFVPGAQAIVLSEHVTYWNHDGWQDPFSLDYVTDRQQQYANRFGLDSSYTPQAVIDGAAQVTGSDEPGLTRAIARAAAAPTAALEIQDAQLSGSAVRFKVAVGPGSPASVSDAVLMAALADDSAQISVKSGENSGRSLHHVAVVRVLRDMGKGALDGRELTLKPAFGRGQGPARLVVFLVDRRSGHVLGAAERTLTP